MNRPRCLLALALSLTFALRSSAATIVLDTLTDPLLPNPCLPLTQPPIVFSGPFCDGASCPPGTVLQGPCGGSNGRLGMECEQPGLASVHLGATRTISVGGGTTTGVGEVGSVATGAHRVDYRCDAGVVAWIHASYAWSAPVDLRAGGSERLVFEVMGDLSPALPMFVQVYIGDAVSDGAGKGPFEITAPGVLTLPLADFEYYPPDFDLSQVVSIGVDLVRCFNCSGVSLDSRQFALGTIRLEGGAPTTAARRTWGRLKASYR